MRPLIRNCILNGLLFFVLGFSWATFAAPAFGQVRSEYTREQIVEEIRRYQAPFQGKTIAVSGVSTSNMLGMRTTTHFEGLSDGNRYRCSQKAPCLDFDQNGKMLLMDMVRIEHGFDGHISVHLRRPADKVATCTVAKRKTRDANLDPNWFTGICIAIGKVPEFSSSFEQSDQVSFLEALVNSSDASISARTVATNVSVESTSGALSFRATFEETPVFHCSNLEVRSATSRLNYQIKYAMSEEGWLPKHTIRSLERIAPDDESKKRKRAIAVYSGLSFRSNVEDREFLPQIPDGATIEDPEGALRQ